MSLPVLTSKLLDVAGVRHAFFTRNGGVSRGIYASLNVGLGSGDDQAAVIENRARCAAHFGAEAIVTAYQVHSATALVADGPWPDGPPQVDGVVSATPGVVCGALAADCAPVLLADAEGRVVAACHAGWKGRTDRYRRGHRGPHGEPGRATRAPGGRRWPLYRARSYEVGLEFLERFVAADAAYAGFFQPGAGPDKAMFDLPAFVLGRLAAAGVTSCEWVGRDTCAEADDFFSNRRAFKLGEPDYGRLLSAIVLDAA